MLTENEKHWLRNKRLKGFRYNICRWCFAYPVASWERAPSPCVIYCHNNGVPALCEGLHSARGIKEAAEFEAKVAAKLAITGDVWDFEDMPCRGERQYMISKCPLRKNHWECADCYIKAARLQVEEEMDGE